MADADITAELNRLYWKSDDSVGEIAGYLDLSRRSLYEHLDPQPAGVPCPECDAQLVFRNRTARDTGEAECPECERTVDLDEAPVPDEAQPGGEEEGRAPLSQVARLDRSGAMLAIALLGGLTLGAVIAYLRRGD